MSRTKPLKPDSIYEKRDTCYYTDAKGRTKKVTFKQLKLSTGKRTKLQTAIGKLGYGVSELSYDKYEGGHLIGDQFGHDATRENLVPMCFQMNRSKYKAMENVWSKALKNNICVKRGTIRIIYFGDTECPCFIDVSCTVGKEKMVWHFVHSEIFIGNTKDDVYKDLFV